MNVIYTFQAGHITQLHALYRKEWWSNTRTLEETQAVIAGSTLCIGLLDQNNDLLAFTRVLSDGIFKAFIFDVIVHDQARGSGLGDQLITLVKNHPHLARVKHFELYCHPDKVAFYARHGFTTAVGEMNLMRLTTR